MTIFCICFSIAFNGKTGNTLSNKIGLQTNEILMLKGVKQVLLVKTFHMVFYP